VKVKEKPMSQSRIPKLVRRIHDRFLKVEEWQVPGVPHTNEIVRATDSVTVLLRDIERDRVLLVKQRRVAMCTDENPEGWLTELVAGRFDVDLGPIDLVIKEAQEEAGVTLKREDVRLLNQGEPLALSAGILTERAYLAYATFVPDQLSGDDTDTFGVQTEGEAITRVWMSTNAFLLLYTPEDLRVFALQQYLLAQTSSRSNT